MLSRTLRLAALTILTGSLFAIPAQGQNLDAGKTPAQLFSGTCNACHKSARGLLRSVAPGSLPGFLRQHYTTSTDMAKTLSGFLLANGATDQTRVANVPTNRQGRPDAQPGNPQAASAPDGAKPPGRERPPAPQQQAAARPDSDGLNPPPGEGAAQRPPRNAKQAARAPELLSDLPPPQALPKGAKANIKRGAEPAVAALATDTNAKTDAAISAAVPLPESADLPPPTIADFKIDPPKADVAAPAAPNSSGSPPAAKAAAAAAPAATPPQRTSSASLAPKPGGPPPSPPISH